MAGGFVRHRDGEAVGREGRPDQVGGRAQQAVHARVRRVGGKEDLVIAAAFGRQDELFAAAQEAGDLLVDAGARRGLDAFVAQGRAQGVDGLPGAAGGRQDAPAHGQVRRPAGGARRLAGRRQA